MQPIHYSLILNLAVLIVLGALSYAFQQPLLVIVGLLLANHAIARFSNEEAEDDDGEPAIGFNADIR